METKPLSSKQTSEDLSSYNPSTTSTAKRDQSHKDELLSLVQNLENDVSTLKNSNQKLLNDTIKKFQENSELIMSINNTMRNIESMNASIVSSEKDIMNLQGLKDSLLNNLSTKTTQINALQSSNDKYINQNKVIKNHIKKIREKVGNAYDYCKDLDCFNKD